MSASAVCGRARPCSLVLLLVVRRRQQTLAWGRRVLNKCALPFGRPRALGPRRAACVEGGRLWCQSFVWYCVVLRSSSSCEKTKLRFSESRFASLPSHIFTLFFIPFCIDHTTTDPSFPQLLMVLTQEEIDACRAAFQAFDPDKTGTLDVAALRGVLGFLGQKPTEDELFMMIAEVDEGMSGMLDFGELLRVIEVQKAKALAFDDEGDMVDAFVACGGRADRQGHVKRETLVRIIKKDFGLMIDIEELINKVDTDGYVDGWGWRVWRGGWGRMEGGEPHVLFSHSFLP